MTQPTPQAPGPGAKGPLGQPRDPGQQALLSLVTCGLYAYYWAYLNYEELKQHNGEGLGGVVGALLGLVFVGWFLLPSEIQKMYQADGRQSPVDPLVGLWLLLPLAGIYIYVNKVQTALNESWISKGAQPVS